MSESILKRFDEENIAKRRQISTGAQRSHYFYHGGCLSPEAPRSRRLWTQPLCSQYLRYQRKYNKHDSVSRWSGEICKDKDVDVTRRSSTGEHDGPLGFNDVSALFLVVSAVILLCVITTGLLFVVRCRQICRSNDQASLAVASWLVILCMSIFAKTQLAKQRYKNFTEKAPNRNLSNKWVYFINKWASSPNRRPSKCMPPQQKCIWFCYYLDFDRWTWNLFQHCLLT